MRLWQLLTKWGYVVPVARFRILSDFVDIKMRAWSIDEKPLSRYPKYDEVYTPENSMLPLSRELSVQIVAKHQGKYRINKEEVKEAARGGINSVIVAKEPNIVYDELLSIYQSMGLSEERLDRDIILISFSRYDENERGCVNNDGLSDKVSLKNLDEKQIKVYADMEEQNLYQMAGLTDVQKAILRDLSPPEAVAYRRDEISIKAVQKDGSVNIEPSSEVYELGYVSRDEAVEGFIENCIRVADKDEVQDISYYENTVCEIKQDLYEEYLGFCEKVDAEPYSKKWFYRESVFLSELPEYIEKKKVTAKKDEYPDRVRVVLGVELLDEGWDFS